MLVEFLEFFHCLVGVQYKLVAWLTSLHCRCHPYAVLICVSTITQYIAAMGFSSSSSSSSSSSRSFEAKINNVVCTVLLEKRQNAYSLDFYI